MLKKLTDYYMVLILAVLPLYTGGSYYLLGDRKYLLFRNGTLFCLGLALVCKLLLVIGERLPDEAGKLSQSRFWDRIRWSGMDFCMFAYAGCVVLSALQSAYRRTAWLGYRDWYMGALSQLLFVGVYFLVSREYSYQAYPLYLGDAALLAVVLIGMLQKLEIDVCGLMKVYNDGDWEYSHMLSTVGNINWLSSYLGMALPLAICGFLYAESKWKQGLLYGVSVLGLMMLWIQGSDSGILACGVLLGICALAGMFRRTHFQKAMLLGTGMSFGLPFFALIIRLWGNERTMPADGNALERIASPFWWIAGLFCWILFLLPMGLGEKNKKRFIRGILLLAAASVLLAGIYLAPRLWQREDSGNGRGTLWALAIEQFRQTDVRGKLFGAGPDCYAEAIDTRNVMQDGHWEGVIFANAHNEWLNTLVNLGILGTAAYLSLFVCGLIRYRRLLLGILVIGVYGASCVISFQQVMNAPYLFLLLGLCESRLRREAKNDLRRTITKERGMEKEYEMGEISH